MSDQNPPPPPPSGGYSMDPKEAKAQAKAQQAHAKSLRPWYKKKRFMIPLVLLVIIVIATAASGGGDDDKKSDNAGASDDGGGDNADASDDGGSTEQEIFAVGDTSTTGDFEVTLHTVQDPFVPTNEFETPPDGQRFVAVEMTFTNTTDDNVPLSTLLGFELKDSENRPWDITIAGIDLPQLDGDVAANDSRRGWAVFAVAEDATGLTLRVKGSLTANGSLYQL